MKYFKKQEPKYFTKTAGQVSDLIDRKAWRDNPLYQTDGTAKLMAALDEIEERKPLGAGKNPDPTSDYIMPDLGMPGIGS